VIPVRALGTCSEHHNRLTTPGARTRRRPVRIGAKYWPHQPVWTVGYSLAPVVLTETAPVVVAATAPATAAATFVAAPVVAGNPGPCNWLTKEYTQDGAVVFKDLCTNELPLILRRCGRANWHPRTAQSLGDPPADRHERNSPGS
jgi:hypothetical protein